MTKNEPFDLGISGINCHIAHYDPMTAIITLPRPRVVLSGKDHNRYVHGSVKRNSGNPGCTQSQTLGLAIADLRAVVHVYFKKDYGVAIKLRYTPDQEVITLRQAAQLVLNEADALECRTLATSTNP